MKTKKRSWLLAVLVGLLVMALGAGSALAGGVAPPYDSWCGAYTNNNDQGNEHYAYAEEGNTFAESRVDGWLAGAQVYAYVDQNASFAGSLDADAWFSQQFEVTAAGPAKINFAYDGSLSVMNQNPGVGTIDGYYSLEFYFSAWDSYSNSYEDEGYLGGEGFDSYGEPFTFDYNFTGEDVGNIFTVDLYLDTWMSTEYVGYTGAGGAEFMADFYNTGEIVNVEGGIAPVGGPPVPIPGAVWLLGSGLFGLVAIRRRKKG